MLRRLPTYLVLAACVTAGSALAAPADQQAARGRSGGPGGGRAAAAPAPAPVPVTPADVASMLGAWQIPLETPTGRLVATLVFRVEAGKVVAGVSAPSFPEHKITDITKSGNVLTLKAATDYSGALSSYSGRVEMVLTLSPKGEDRAALFDFNTGKYQIGGTAKKQG
jgi:hypothetical protein